MVITFILIVEPKRLHRIFAENLESKSVFLGTETK